MEAPEGQEMEMDRSRLEERERQQLTSCSHPFPRRHGRPKIRWRRNAEAERKDLGLMSWNDVELEAKCRD